MANLITDKQRKIVKIDYGIRLSTVSICIASLFGIFFLAYVVPYLISINKKDQIVAEQFQSVIVAENKENVGESASRLVSQVLDELKAVEIYTKDRLTPSIYFSKIVENKNSDIQITRLSFDFIKKGQEQFLISGISKSREGLVSFIEALKNEAGFASVESPISDFAKDNNIPFTLNVKIAI